MTPVGVDEILRKKESSVARMRSDSSWMQAWRTRPRSSFLNALKKPGLSVIAEVKRSSPSTGPLNVDVDNLCAAYCVRPVDALSILTDEHFGMSSEDLRRLAATTAIPILRKDFTISREQIYEADLIGADAVLLIATFLSADQLDDFGGYAESLGLDVLYEAHSAEDLVKIPASAKIVGINNRSLASGDYRTDTNLAESLRASIPQGVIRIAESGYERPADVPQGWDAVLIGTGMIRHFVREGRLP